MSKLSFKWYVYELSDNDGVFYVGKGSGDRINQTCNDGSLEKKQRAANCTKTIVAYFCDEVASFVCEKERIELYGVQNLTNMIHGAKQSPRMTKSQQIEKQNKRYEYLWSIVMSPEDREYHLKLFDLNEEQMTIASQINQLLTNIYINGYPLWQQAKTLKEKRSAVDLLELLIRKVPHYDKPYTAAA